MKLAQTKLIDAKTAIKGPEVDLIELANIVMDFRSVMQREPTFEREYFSAVFFRVILPYPSLFFFRSRHLFTTLHYYATDPVFSKEKAFWQKSEDLILRSKAQLTVQDLATVVSIYKHVPVSQIFWNEMEQTILGKSADFKGDKKMLLQVVLAFSHRNNETFWKVFSTHLCNLAD